MTVDCEALSGLNRADGDQLLAAMHKCSERRRAVALGSTKGVNQRPHMLRMLPENKEDFMTVLSLICGCVVIVLAPFVFVFVLWIMGM